MPLINKIADLHDEITSWRHELHRHPELGYQELWTSDFVAKQLEACGICVDRGLASTGVVGTLTGKQRGEGLIALRADFDALPIEERGNLHYKSRKPGLMHACGHDGHTAMLLGAAKYLSQTRDFAGTVHFVFQPAEEGGGGGLKMIREGLFRKFPTHSVYAMHNIPGIPCGEFAMRPGAIMASADEFEIEIEGKGGHAAMPENCVDPVTIAAQLIMALQMIVSRETDPLRPVVLSCTRLHSEGTALNVIPEIVRVSGTLRALDEAVRDYVFERVRTVAEGLCQSMRASCRCDFRYGYPVTINHKAHVDIAADVASEIVGSKQVERDIAPLMGAEDFSYMLNEKPGAYIFLGNGASGQAGSKGLHTPDYDFNDEAIPYGVSFWVRLVERSLTV